MTHPAKPSVVVIGAGMAGLAAARRLAAVGVNVTVLEKNDYVGGRVYTDKVQEIEVDAGAQFIANFYPHTLRFIRELGLQDDLIRITALGAVYRDGRLHTLWPDWRLMITPLISFRSKLTLLRTFGTVLRHWSILDNHAFHKAYSLDTQSVTDYARQALTDEVLEYVFQPPLSGVFYWTTEQTSLAILLILLKSGLGIKIYTLRHGLGQLAEAMATDLTVHLNSAVEKVLIDPDNRYQIQAQVDGKTTQFSADGLVCATPATAVPKLFSHLHSRQLNFFENIRYSANVTTAIGIGRRLPSQLYGLLFPRSETENLAIAAIQSAKNPAQVPSGQDLMVLYPTGPASQTLLQADDETVQRRLLADLSLVGPDYDPSPDLLWAKVYRWQQALPLFEVGHFQRLKTFMAGGIESERLVFAGDYLGGPFIEGAVTSGLEAADRLLKQLV